MPRGMLGPVLGLPFPGVDGRVPTTRPCLGGRAASNAGEAFETDVWT